MNNPKETVVAAIVTAGVAVMATELLRRLTSENAPGQKPLADIPVSKFGRQLLREEFDSRPGYVFCNCGSFGHVPQRIIQEQLKYAKQRERDTDAWFRFSEGEKSKYFESVRQISEFVGADKNNLVLVENASFGMTTALRSLHFVSGDKILVNSHTYTSVLNTVRQLAEDIPGLEIVEFDLQLPIKKESDIVPQFEKAIDENPGIKVVVLDHISSVSAILMPVKPILDLCHKKGLIVVVDGAHAPGQIPLNLEQLQADYYVGNLHKWMLAPRGSALLYVNPKHHDGTRPLVPSHNHFKKTLADRFVPSATRDSTAYLVLPEVIKFHKALGGLDVIFERNKALVTAALKVLAEAWGTDIYPVSEEFRAPFMGMVALPKVFQDSFTPDDPNCSKLMKAMSAKGAFVVFTPINGRIWDVIFKRNRVLVIAALKILAEAWGTDIYPVSEEFRAPFMGMVALPKVFQDNFTPDGPDCNKLMKAMSALGAFVCFMPIKGRIWARVSVHVWNCMEDFYVVRDVVLEMMDEIPTITKITV